MQTSDFMTLKLLYVVGGGSYSSNLVCLYNMLILLN